MTSNVVEGHYDPSEHHRALQASVAGAARQSNSRGITLDEAATNEEGRRRRDRAALRPPTPIFPQRAPYETGIDRQEVDTGEVKFRDPFNSSLQYNANNVCNLSSTNTSSS